MPDVNTGKGGKDRAVRAAASELQVRSMESSESRCTEHVMPVMALFRILFVVNWADEGLSVQSHTTQLS